MASSLRLVVSRHLRDPATASNFFLFVSINQFQRVNDTQGGITLQEVYHIKALFPFHIDQMAEVPTDQIINSGDRANRHMAGVIAIFRGEDGLAHVSGGELVWWWGGEGRVWRAGGVFFFPSPLLISRMFPGAKAVARSSRTRSGAS